MKINKEHYFQSEQTIEMCRSQSDLQRYGDVQKRLERFIETRERKGFTVKFSLYYTNSIEGTNDDLQRIFGGNKWN